MARPELEQVTQLILENPRTKAADIAEQIGLDKTMGPEKAVNYIKSVRQRLRKNGAIAEAMSNPKMANDEAMLADISRLIEYRQGRMTKQAAYNLLLLNCYYRLRSADDKVHWNAIDHTYEVNAGLNNPFSTSDAIHICEIALEKYMDSINEEKNEAARRKGFPNAGLNYTNENLYFKLDIRDDELSMLETITKPSWY